MKELSMHILDIVENSTRAGADTISIKIVEDSLNDSLTIQIEDNGKGMTEEEVTQALQPFFTTKGKNSVGLGLPLLKHTAERCEGQLKVDSAPGMGTKVYARMKLGHIDRPPMGDLNETLSVIIGGNPGIDFDITYDNNGEVECFTTRQNMPEADESIEVESDVSMTGSSGLQHPGHKTER
ncbi:MAG TPA: ATP-binding protein [bacterium]|nr:ATP-binding protein [bacterium]